MNISRVSCSIYYVRRVPREAIGHQIYSVISVLPRDAVRIARTILLQDFFSDRLLYLGKGAR